MDSNNNDNNFYSNPSFRMQRHRLLKVNLRELKFYLVLLYHHKKHAYSSHTELGLQTEVAYFSDLGIAQSVYM